MDNQIKVLVVDPHPVARAGVRQHLRALEDVEVVDEAGDGHEAMRKHRLVHPDITLIDIDLPSISGIATMETIRLESPAARFVVLASAFGEGHIRRAVAAGARSFLSKADKEPDLADVLRAVGSGQTCFNPWVVALAGPSAVLRSFTVPELSTLKRLVSGRSNRAIAEEIGLTEAAVKNHVKAILGKLGVEGRTGAVIEALRRGIVDMDCAAS